MRVTMKHLEYLVARINRITGSPDKPYPPVSEGHRPANVGNYHLDCSYGGVALVRMHNEAGGIENVFGCGHVTKADLHNRLATFIAGIEWRTNNHG